MKKRKTYWNSTVNVTWHLCLGRFYVLCPQFISSAKKPTVYLNMTLFSRSRACVFHFYFTRGDKKNCLQLTKVLKIVDVFAGFVYFYSFQSWKSYEWFNFQRGKIKPNFSIAVPSQPEALLYHEKMMKIFAIMYQESGRLNYKHTAA
jgi:hypothetical protein